MNNQKAKRVTALRKVGVHKKDVEDFRKSSREYLVMYMGRESKVITPQLLAKVSELIEVRRAIGVEIAGAIFEDNLTVTFIFYVNGNPEDAWFEKNIFECAEDFEIELNRQISSNFIPDGKKQQVIYKYGTELELILF